MAEPIKSIPQLAQEIENVKDFVKRNEEAVKQLLILRDELQSLVLIFNDKNAIAKDVMAEIDNDQNIKNRLLQIVSAVVGNKEYLLSPQHITVTPTATTINVKWESIKEGVGYIVNYKLAGTHAYKPLPATPANGATIAGLQPNTEYEVNVTTIKGTHKSGQSKNILVKTLS